MKMLLVAVGMLAAAASAHAEITCGPKDAALAGLKERFGEVPVWTGNMPHGPMMLLQAPTGTWTLLAIGEKDGGPVVCLVTAGTGSRMIAPSAGSGDGA